MILYLDSSALVKLYTRESGSDETTALASRADALGTALIARAEVAAAFSKAVRLKALTREEAGAALEVFRRQWPDLLHVEVSMKPSWRRQIKRAWVIRRRGIQVPRQRATCLKKSHNHLDKQHKLA